MTVVWIELGLLRTDCVPATVKLHAEGCLIFIFFTICLIIGYLTECSDMNLTQTCQGLIAVMDQTLQNNTVYWTVEGVCGRGLW
jgi:hypothetical protein